MSERVTIANESEILREFKIDWKNWIPAGGFAWQEDFQENKAPELNKAIMELEAHRNAILHAEGETKEMQRGVVKGKMFLEALAIHFGKYASMADRKAAEIAFGGDGVWEWLDKAPKMMDTLGARLMAKREDVDLTGKEEKAIALMNAIRNLFVYDYELDSLMWSLSLIPTKNRTKVWRMAYRLYKSVMECYQVIDGSTSDAKGPLMRVFGEPIEKLRVAYADMALVFRTMKKQMEKLGERFWMTYEEDPVRDSQGKLAAATSQESWPVVEGKIW